MAKDARVEALTTQEALRYATERAARENAVMYIWRSETADEVRIAVRHHASGEPWIAGARSEHLFTVYPDGRAVASENRTEVR